MFKMLTIINDLMQCQCQSQKLIYIAHFCSKPLMQTSLNKKKYTYTHAFFAIPGPPNLIMSLHTNNNLINQYTGILGNYK